MVRMRIRIDFAGNSSNNVVLLLHPGQLELVGMCWWCYRPLAIQEIRL